MLVVDPARNRLCLTLKKTLVESDLPVVSSIEDATSGTITHAVVFKNLDKGLLVEFYNNLRGFVPQREIKYASETPCRCTLLTSTQRQRSAVG